MLPEADYRDHRDRLGIPLTKLPSRGRSGAGGLALLTTPVP